MLEAPFTDAILSTNYAPFPVEISQIQTFISEAKVLLESHLPSHCHLIRPPSNAKTHPRFAVGIPPKRLGNHGRKGRKLHKYLLQVRDDLQKLIEVHEALLSPMRRLPSELLEEVFLHCVTHHSVEGESASSHPDTISVIRRTCRQWRSVADSAPRVWCSLKLTSIIDENVAKKKAILEHWLDRSGACLLSLHLSFPDAEMKSTTFDTIFAVVSSVSSRWHRMLLVFPNQFLLPLYRTLQSLDTLPYLVDLDILDTYDGHRCCGDPHDLDVPTTPLQISVLRRLTVMHSGNLSAFLSNFPLTQLNYLSLTQCFYSDNSSFDHVFQELSTLPNLIHLDICLCFLDDVEQYAMVELPSIVHFTVRWSQNWISYLDALILPQVEHIQLKGFSTCHAYEYTLNKLAHRSMRSVMKVIEKEGNQVDIDLGAQWDNDESSCLQRRRR